METPPFYVATEFRPHQKVQGQRKNLVAYVLLSIFRQRQLMLQKS